MTADQPLLCPTCQGVLVATDSSAYTASRGRLIVTNGYCRGHHTPAEQAQHSASAPAGPNATAPVRRPAHVTASSAGQH
ncbi:hypothetical protein MF672_019405 [Actinomadura sp. ATCC 31491]|uniref:Uncharacterized protein n=1 Tax=Actinomadura luzonensis TaxID=2805427 RepID=A0ABT0FUF2_9ACTN|nr:hypothetical protein [Actinomadura luzonensis]MCK2215946.1 hypothetical protein [Actinomadura luzonensis]